MVRLSADGTSAALASITIMPASRPSAGRWNQSWRKPTIRGGEASPTSAALLAGMAANAALNPAEARGPIATAMKMAGATDLAAAIRRSCEDDLTRP